MKEIRELEKAERELDQAQKEHNSTVFHEKFDRLPPVVKSAAVGAAVGSMVPVIGTGIGAVIGGVAGLAWKWKNR
jgi:ABC-type transport system involved in cytochrome c biogenesis permease subunit